jgi:phosphate transport system protein
MIQRGAATTEEDGAWLLALRRCVSCSLTLREEHPPVTSEPANPEDFVRRIDRLRADLFEQGRRVGTMLERSVEALFERDEAKGRRVVEADEVIDQVDVEVERAAVRLLKDVAAQVAAIEDDQLRMVLTIVKINNELERIADAAVDIAEMSLTMGDAAPPGAFRVMANSVIGLLRDTINCFERLDTELAKRVLASDETIDEFERMILRDTQRGLAEGRIDVDAAFALHAMAARLEIINDHCSNIAEQVIYVATGAIVRHQGGQWSEPRVPD